MSQRDSHRRGGRASVAGMVALVLVAAVVLTVNLNLITLTAAPDIYPQGTTEIFIVWRNGTLHTVYWNALDTLERYDSGQWLPIEQALQNPMELYTIGPLGTYQLAFPLAGPPLSAGRYRISASCSVNQEILTRTAEFTIE